MISSSFQILFGLIFLFLGAEGLVRASASLAKRLGVSSLIIGLTIVAFGTSTPELIVSIKAALAGQPALSVGNVVGSNIFNIAVILGLSSLISPLRVDVKLLKTDTPIMIFVSCLFAILFLDHRISRLEGSFFIVLIIAYTVLNFTLAKKSGKQDEKKMADETSEIKLFKNIYLDLAVLAAGLFILFTGANWFIAGSVQVARAFGISEAVIGLTLVSVGTSLPELATSVVAAIRKNADIAIGNIVGSNLMNILCILGISATITPIHAADILIFDIGAMLFFTVLLLPFIRTGYCLERWEGTVLFAGYLIYIVLRIGL